MRIRVVDTLLSNGFPADAFAEFVLLNPSRLRHETSVRDTAKLLTLHADGRGVPTPVFGALGRRSAPRRLPEGAERAAVLAAAERVRTAACTRPPKP